MEHVFFETDTSGPVEVAIEGRIDFSLLGRKFGFDPMSIALNGVQFSRTGLESKSTWTLIKAGFKKYKNSVGKEDDPIMVTGQAPIPVHAVSTEGEPSSKKRNRSGAEPLHLDFVDERSYMRNLLETPRDLPVGVQELLEFLSKISEPLPVWDPSILLSVRDDSLVTLYSPAQTAIAAFVDVACKAFLQRPNNEADSSHKLRILTGDFLEGLNDRAPREQKLLHLTTTMNSARNPGSASASTALVHLKRPDFALYVRDALILRWENKLDSAYFTTVLEENTEKLKIWSPLYYGELPFVIGGCCGGGKFQWLRLSPNGKVIRADPISVQFDLFTPSSVLLLLHSVVQMHRLLQKLQERLTTAIPVRLYKEIMCVNGTVLLCPAVVLKTLVPNLAIEKVNFLQSLYESITGSKNLIQLEGRIISSRFSTKLTLHPVGHPNGRPTCLTQLRNATHDILHGLMVLHKAGYTHRDLCWENCIRENVQGEWKWIIIDLESAGRDGDLCEHDRMVNWDAGTLNDNKSYTKGSDMYELGKLILNRLGDLVEDSDEGKSMRALGENLMKERGEAAQMLRYRDMYPEGCARCAMFST